MHKILLVAILAGSTSASAQNLIPNGEFHQGPTSWTLTAFNDPSGTTGFDFARVAGYGPSQAVFADFQTLTSVRSATYRSTAVVLPPAPLPVGFRVLWEKQVTTPIPSPSVNRVELRIIDTATNTAVYTGTLPSPNQTGLTESASFHAVATVPALGSYEFELFIRHSNLAGIPFTCWVDDAFCGSLNVDFFGQGCAGSGGFVPAIGTSNAPLINTNDFSLEVSDTFGPTAAIVLADFSNTTWAGGPLPFPLGSGCDLLVGLGASAFQLVATSGAGSGMASQTVPIPNDPGLTGLVFYSQWGVFDPAAGSVFGVAMSAGLSIIVQ
ncbi:MAG TPA: hypothetical protein VFZ65_07445 [Planctomycetota bacterium]|nr:hypothetical protein [Planctomycetota bacterium]